MSETFQIASGYDSLLASCGLSDLDAVFRWDKGECLDKPGLENWRQRWRISLADRDSTKHTFYLKRFSRPPLRRQIERWRGGHFSLSTAGIEWTNARLLAEGGIKAVEPIAFGQQMSGLWECRSFIMLREVDGESLEKWVPVHLLAAHEETKPECRKDNVDRLARFVADFHKAGFVHRDLYLSHIFTNLKGMDCTGDGPDSDQMFCLIDLQRVFKPRCRHLRWVVKDLSALDFSTPSERFGRYERLRFLCRYVRSCSQFGSARPLAKLIGAKSARIARRYASKLSSGGHS